MTHAIEVTHLRKEYGKIVAVDDLSFTVPGGAVLGLLGGNGAGKTTTISMLLGLLEPTSGSVKVLGIDMLTQRFKALPRMNFSSPYVDLPHRLTVKQNLDFYGRLYGVPDVKKRLVEIAETLQIGDMLDRPAGALSAGQKTRVALAKALINEPELLLLDEPSEGLAPIIVQRIGEVLRQLRGTGATVLIAEQNMHFCLGLASHATVIDKGQIVYTSGIEELKANDNIRQRYLAL